MDVDDGAMVGVVHDTRRMDTQEASIAGWLDLWTELPMLTYSDDLIRTQQ